MIKSDQIAWITTDSQAGEIWLDWVDEFKNYLNRRLFLGLFSFESHFSHYQPGAYYKKHFDAFKSDLNGESNRVLSIIVYLNSDWQSADGGELVLYQKTDNNQGIKISPHMGTLVTFLSEEFPHEVFPANRDRFSIAGWFRGR